MDLESPPVDRTMLGPLTAYLADDHRRLDALFHSVSIDPNRVDGTAYQQFRVGLLRHIGMEEKILLPAAQRLNSGGPAFDSCETPARSWRLAALLMTTPTAAIIKAIHGILANHPKIRQKLEFSKYRYLPMQSD